MITAWEVPFTLQSPTLGDLDLNVVDGNGRAYYLVPDACQDQIAVRATRTPIPAADGTIPNRRFLDSYITRLAIQLWANDAPACDQDLTDMTDDLMGWLWSMLNDEGRLRWTPYTGYGDERMYDEVRWLDDAEWSLDEAGFSRITFSLDTPFPYAIDATQQTIPVTSAGANLTNTGNTKHWPVIKVYGPVGAGSTFVIENTTTGEQLEYDTNLPGAPTLAGGDYMEIDTFRNTAYKNGSGANMKPGIYVPDSDFWGLEPGVNALDSDGPSFDVLFNPPWV